MTSTKQSSHIMYVFISGLTGILTAYALASSIYRSALASPLDWVIALVFLTLAFGMLFYLFLPSAWKQFSEASRSVQYWVLSLTVLSAGVVGFHYGLLFLVVALLFGFISITPGIPRFHELLVQKRVSRFVIAWALAGFASFFMLGIFKNFHPTLWEFVLFTILFNAFFTLLANIILEQITASLKSITTGTVISIGISLLGWLLVALSVRLLSQYPSLFSTSFFLPTPNTIPAFFVLTILTQSWTAFLEDKLDAIRWRQSSVVLWIKRNAPGLMLASALTIFAYLFATVLVSTEFGLTDNYFDTDSPVWVNFLTANANDVAPMRAVHPFVLMILRPPVWLLSLLLGGNKFHAVLLLNALTAGACALLTWSFFKRRTNNTAYALAISTLLGFSTAHLLLSVFLESYIFSALAVITAVVLLENEDAKLLHVIPAGLAAFGITVTNFIQTCIAFLFTQRSIKRTFQYVMITLAFATLLTFIQSTIQPNSQAFYIVSSMDREFAFKRDVASVPVSETLSRANVISRTIVLSSMVAPRPFIFLEEVGCAYPCFNTIHFFGGKYQYASYIGFGSWLARSWFLLLVIATLLFAWSFIKSPKSASLQLAFALNILFNFVLHMNYGDDPLLYSPDWTYALVFFFGISYEKIADKKWFQVVLWIFLIALLFNNVELFRKILDAILPFKS